MSVLTHSIWLVTKNEQALGTIFLAGAEFGSYAWKNSAWFSNTPPWFSEILKEYQTTYQGQDIDEARSHMKSVLQRNGYEIIETLL